MATRRMRLRTARIVVVLVGIALPYLARLPRGLDWVAQYTGNTGHAWLFLAAFNAVAWGAVLAISFAYRHAASLLFPAIAGFGFLAVGHFTLDLAADPQSALGLVFLPVYALAPIAVGGVAGRAFDRWLRRRALASGGGAG